MPTMIDTRELNAERTRLDKQAQDAHAEYVTARESAAEAGADLLNPESAAYTELKAKHDAYSALKNRYEEVTDRILELSQMNGDPDPDASGGRRRGVDERAIASFSEAVTQRILKGEDYTDLAKRFVASQSARVGGEKNLGQALTRQEFVNLVTGADAGSGGAFVLPQRDAYVPLAQRPVSIFDLVSVGQTNTDLIEYVRQVTMPTSAAMVAEATSINDGAKPMGTITFEVVQDTIKTIAEGVYVTRRAFADAAQLQSIIEDALRYDLRRVLENEMITEDGNGEHLLGLDNVPNTGSYVQGTLDGDETAIDAVQHALTVSEIAGEPATAIGLNSTDWDQIAVAKDDDGNYLMGGPNAAVEKRMWGVPVVTSPAFSAGSAYVANFRAFKLWVREGVNILVSDSNRDLFEHNILTLLAEGRYGFASPRPAALTIATITP